MQALLTWTKWICGSVTIACLERDIVQTIVVGTQDLRAERARRGHRLLGPRNVVRGIGGKPAIRHLAIGYCRVLRDPYRTSALICSCVFLRDGLHAVPLPLPRAEEGNQDDNEESSETHADEECDSSPFGPGVHVKVAGFVGMPKWRGVLVHGSECRSATTDGDGAWKIARKERESYCV